MKYIFDKDIGNIILKGNIKAFLLKNEIRCLLSHLLFNIILGAIRQVIDIKGVKEIRLSLFGDNITLY